MGEFLDDGERHWAEAREPSEPETVQKEWRGKVHAIDTNFAPFRAVPIPGRVLNAYLSRPIRCKCLHRKAVEGRGVVVVKIQGLGVREPTPCMTWGGGVA